MPGRSGRPRPSTGAPHDTGSYDDRRAALDALHFPKLVDPFWQDLRAPAARCSTSPRWNPNAASPCTCPPRFAGPSSRPPAG
ncbi:MAG TPA: hypothetical protein VFP34_03760 [Microlunatus sp.]|nr:hypothetical protein [Microlunatus sp.]